ncbi:MAG: hypothetical protein ACJ75F_03215 [Flavisolibacter sp.]
MPLSTMRLLSLAVVLLLLSSCKNKNGKPDISGIKVDLKLERLEPAFFSIDTNNMEQGLTKVHNQFPRFFPFYTEVILGVPGRDAIAVAVLKRIISSYKPIYDSVKEKYKKLNWLEDELETGFRYVKYYYPNYRIPGIITFIGTFDAPGVVLTPNYVGIGLQQFAGKNFSAYQNDEIRQMYPEYISRRFDKEFMVPNVMKAIVDDLYPDTSQSAGLIDQMIEKGKQWYLLDHFLPDTEDSLKTGFTKRQLQWCKNNEGNIWGSVMTNTPDIYTLDQERIQNYIGEGPFTGDLPHETSPGNIGQWIGWQIVNRFAEKNPNLTVQQVLSTPARKIFQGAKYKPK